MRTPTFSVIIPCYNAAPTLADSIRSVRDQSEADWEMVVVDDGSTDDSAAIALRLAQSDNRIRVLRVPNGGVSLARNRGIAASSGRYLTFLDADDSWEPETLAVHRQHFDEHADLAVSYGRVSFCDADLRPLGRISARPPDCVHPAMALGENPVCTGSNLAVRRATFGTVGTFTPSLCHGEDQEWLFRVCLAFPHGVVGVDRVLVRYRTSSGGLHGDLTAMEAGWEQMLACAMRMAPEAVTRYRPRAKALHLRMLARRALRVPEQAGLALGYMRRALCSDPALVWESRRTLQTLAASIIVRFLVGPKSRQLAVRLFG